MDGWKKRMDGWKMFQEGWFCWMKRKLVTRKEDGWMKRFLEKEHVQRWRVHRPRFHAGMDCWLVRVLPLRPLVRFIAGCFGCCSAAFGHAVKLVSWTAIEPALCGPPRGWGAERLCRVSWLVELLKPWLRRQLLRQQWVRFLGSSTGLGCILVLGLAFSVSPCFLLDVGLGVFNFLTES